LSRLPFRFFCIFAFAAAAHSCLAADRILFLRLGPTQSTLFIANADGSAERPLTQPGSLNYNPAWSPRGNWIAFTSERAGPANLFRMHPNGSEVERLTADAAYDDQAAFSPDGEQIAFVSTRAEGRESLAPGPRHSQSASADYRAGRRFQAGVVSRWPLDRFLFGPGQQPSHGQKPLGAAPTRRHLPHSPGWLWAQAYFAARELLRNSQMDG
jgi:dipeptidyl aminopeptidase/acylaminoacyl peptidase